MQVQTISATTIPGYNIYEYLLVLNSHKELCDKIMEVKMKFADDYKSEQAKTGKSQVLLANFVQYEMMQERLLNRLRIVAMGTTPFKVELRDFGSFPTHTIFINVVSKVPIQKLIKNLKHESNKLMTLNKDNKPYFPDEPHLTIAKKLVPWQYEKGWLEYINKNFTGRFIADKMVLLRRPAGEMKYHVVQKFEFQNMPVMIKQGELFV
jgi:2'-5' RNA ligase